MQKKELTKQIAYAGVGGAVSLAFLMLGYVIPIGRITLYTLACLGVMVPLARRYFGAGLLLVVGVSILAGILLNTAGIYFAVVSGGFTLLSLFFYMHTPERTPQKPLFWIVKGVYAVGAYFVLVWLFSIISVVNLPTADEKTILIAGLFLALVVAFVYDYAVTKIFAILKVRLFDRLKH